MQLSFKCRLPSHHPSAIPLLFLSQQGARFLGLHMAFSPPGYLQHFSYSKPRTAQNKTQKGPPSSRTVKVHERSYGLPPELSFTPLQQKRKSNPACKESSSCCLMLALLLDGWEAEEITHPGMELPVRNHQTAERPPTHRPGMFQWKPSVTPVPASSDTLQLFDGKHLSVAINLLGMLTA